MSTFLPSRLKNEFHPLHVSTTEVSFNPKEKSLEISCRIFTDDFENALTKQYKGKVDLNKPSMQKQMDELIKKYINSRLSFTVNNKNTSANYIGFEIDQEATNIYLEITNVANLQTLSVNNALMYELFDDQMNILHVEKAGARKSIRVLYPVKQMAVAF